MQTIPCDLSLGEPCSATLAVPAGLNTFAVVDEDSNGDALSRSTFQQTCSAGSTTRIAAVLSGVVSSVTVALFGTTIEK